MWGRGPALYKQKIITFFDCHLSFFQFFHLNFFFFQWPKVDQVRNEYSPQLSKLMALLVGDK